VYYFSVKITLFVGSLFKTRQYDFLASVTADLHQATEEFKAQIALLNDTMLEKYSQPQDRFILQCTFAGKDCEQYV